MHTGIVFSLSRFFIVIGVYVAYVLLISPTLPGKNSTLFIILLLLGIAALFVILFYFKDIVASPKYKRLMNEGRDATAVVKQISDTGITLNQNPYLRLRLEVHPDNASPFEATVSALVFRVSMPRAGDQIAVKYDPRNPRDVIIV